MPFERLSHALDTGGLILPDAGRIALWPGTDIAGSALFTRDNCDIISRFFPVVAAWKQRGFTVLDRAKTGYAAAVIVLPRQRDLAESLIAQASQVTNGPLVITGAKTDGVEAILKALKTRVPLMGVVSKAHGKCLWWEGAAAQTALHDWLRPDMQPNAQGDMTAPGVFSADKADPASVALAKALPQTLKGHFADFGAGWGWLSRQVLTQTGVTSMHLVEADAAALDCARSNVVDARAVFHWADATKWERPVNFDGIVMNPPFHTGRKADPALGQAFITAAAQSLAPNGALWMVANRHLPYEATLADCFRKVAELPGTPGFKIFHAERPTRPRR